MTTQTGALHPKATHLLIRHQEIALKGKNRPEFEQRLCRNIVQCMGSYGSISFASGRIVVELKPNVLPSTANDPSLAQNLIDRICQLGGVLAVTPCTILSPEI